jgi:hypothetical protein
VKAVEGRSLKGYLSRSDMRQKSLRAHVKSLTVVKNETRYPTVRSDSTFSDAPRHPLCDRNSFNYFHRRSSQLSWSKTRASHKSLILTPLQTKRLSTTGCTRKSVYYHAVVVVATVVVAAAADSADATPPIDEHERIMHGICGQDTGIGVPVR